MRCRDAQIWRLNLLQLLYNKNNTSETKKALVMEHLHYIFYELRVGKHEKVVEDGVQAAVCGLGVTD